MSGPRMKYVTVAGYGEDEIYIFNETLSHQNFCFRMNIDPKDVMTAGFFTVDPSNGPKFFGKSTTLRKESSPADLIIFKRHCGWDD
ncbi:hypothetical protein EVB32_130 [Rhizobium phage RHph_TM39]|uniref:Uncharacterized protein n=1 Tax=Rhizobium phage RHph_TM30 TaxID=2509764 RepID=A0A7S5R4Z4_9CAUD|nr:hypothetical protein PQC16_gp130 [Rhizobium phage RHph_TM30]QIG71601.1 hypothetical protein EVB94_130 [Rhizobium phage RHph_TM40]QIG71964.1 hypothetical protein EVB95_130 [Rhizobium phage RHph_TM2_3B]QIG72326.1 hypothetical protein EVB96_130 [Rhizobium phage RHph_TM3_3_6]QIG77118.1 hypothetical protein EVB32_130 [Rhizobium phage RHph_TM39]QIG77454.1 hypothetical protein EVB61_126 [Rhizobium phage RHph_TM21B]QIG77716.1 hypothetical protein EVB64_129 [Rhizobium phage RHph_TM61]